VSGAHTPQGGIFALGTASHAYLEFDAAAGSRGRELVAAIASLREPRTTMGGVNLVAGFRPELWRAVLPDDAPAALAGFRPGPGGHRFGKIFRRNMPYGTVSDDGTMFVGFSAGQRPLTAMLESMAGLAGGVRDALTRCTRPVAGAYYFVPSTESLRRIAGDAAPAE
jgi:Dyp-type peroxidase family